MTIHTAISGIYPKLINSKDVPHLKRSLHKFDRGDISADELEEVLRKNTCQIIQEQREAGVTILSDGLIRWESFVSPFIYGWDGLERGPLKRIFDTNTLQRNPLITGAIKQKKSSATTDAIYAQEQLEAGEKLKATLPGPFSFAEDCVDEHYESLESRVESIAQGLNKEFLAYQEAGIPYVELYDPYLYFNKYDAELLKSIYNILLKGINETKVILGSFYGTVQKENLAALENTDLSGFSLDLVTSPESLDWLTSEPVIIQLGILDARTTAQDNLEQARELIKKVQIKYPNAETWIALNNGPEFLPRQSAINKMKSLSEILTK